MKNIIQIKTKTHNYSIIIEENSIIPLIKIEKTSKKKIFIIIDRKVKYILNKIVKRWVPHTYSAFKEFQLESYNLSKTAIEVIKKKLKGQKITFEKSGLSKREWTELTTKFNFK